MSPHNFNAKFKYCIICRATFFESNNSQRKNRNRMSFEYMKSNCCWCATRYAVLSFLAILCSISSASSDNACWSKSGVSSTHKHFTTYCLSLFFSFTIHNIFSFVLKSLGFSINSYGQTKCSGTQKPLLY